MLNSTFVFVGYEATLEEGKASFHYRYGGEKEVSFTEELFFPKVSSKNIPDELLKRVFENLLLSLGLSYWKLYAPKNIKIESFSLSKEQADFWNTVYTKGLGEFFYKNKIDFRGLVKFPYDDVFSSSVLFPRQDRSILGLGGGKDSIVVAEMLKKENKDFDILIQNTRIQKEVAAEVGKKPIIIERKLDSKLFELNKTSGVYNGHIPVSVIYAFMGLLAAVLYDCNSFLVGNEKSANYGNVEYLGETINHQWSKSEEFEKLFTEYVRKFITPSISYSSPIRNLSELEVTEEFVKYPKYFKVFSSCNRNFRIHDPSDKRWCGECAKCLFVFIMLSAFLPKQQVLDIFGKNLLDDEKLLPLFEELIGVKDFKPFECVGTPEEVRTALEMTKKKAEFRDSYLMNFFNTL